LGSVSAVLITFNEEKKIENCLRALAWADEVIVVDGESRDRTVEIASQYTKKIYRRSFDQFSNQKNYGIDLATGDWIFSVDADEIVSSSLRDSLLRIAGEGSDCDGFWVHRTNYLFGKKLLFGGQGNEKILRFFRRDRGRFEQPIHEKVVVKGKVSEVSGELLHYSSSSVEDYLKKLSLYTHFEAHWMKEKGVKPTFFDLVVKPCLRFLYNYVFRLGFLDGYPGFLYHTLSVCYDFLKYARLLELHSKKPETPVVQP